MGTVYYYITIQLYNNTLVGRSLRAHIRCGMPGPRSHRDRGGHDTNDPSGEGGGLSCNAGKKLTHTALANAGGVSLGRGGILPEMLAACGLLHDP